MLNYEKLFKPFEREGYPLEAVLEWLKKTTGADDQIIDQVLSDTMLLVAQGEKFEVPEEYKEYPDMAISHFMEARARSLMIDIEKSRVKILETAEKQRLEARQRLLSKTDREYNKILNGTMWQKFKKFIGANYEHWENE